MNPTFAKQGVHTATLTTIEINNAHVTPVHDAGETIREVSRENARVVIGDGDLIFANGSSLEEIAGWFEQAAAAIRAYTPPGGVSRETETERTA